MCPNCGLEAIRLVTRDEGGAEFACLECGWSGGPESFEVPCTACGEQVAWSKVELDGECNVVCGACYAKNPPAEDIAGRYHDMQVESACAAGWVN